jgi:hypothetical protein
MNSKMMEHFIMKFNVVDFHTIYILIYTYSLILKFL